MKFIMPKFLTILYFLILEFLNFSRSEIIAIWGFHICQLLGIFHYCLTVYNFCFKWSNVKIGKNIGHWTFFIVFMCWIIFKLVKTHKSLNETFEIIQKNSRIWFQKWFCLVRKYSAHKVLTNIELEFLSFCDDFSARADSLWKIACNSQNK